MFKYFPTNYPWNLAVDLAIEMGARIGEIEEMCAPLQDAAKAPDARGDPGVPRRRSSGWPTSCACSRTRTDLAGDRCRPARS